MLRLGRHHLSRKTTKGSTDIFRGTYQAGKIRTRR